MDMKGTDVIRLREEIADQIRALNGMKEMAESYGYDISQPAKNAKEAVQWLYFGYLAAIKTQNGAAMSVGRVSTFLDIYIQRDLENGTLTEEQAQELIDHLVMKFRMVKFARIPSYNRAVLRRPGMGDSGNGRNRNGRTPYGNKERLPFPSHTGEHGTVTGAEPDSTLFFTPSGDFQEICRLYFC